MRTHFLALAVSLTIAGLIAAPLAGASAPSGGAPSGGGVSSGGGGGGGHGGGSGGGRGGGGGHGGGGYHGGGFGGFAAHSRYMVHGGYVAHGSEMGHSGYVAHGGYRIVGSESAGLVHVGAVSRGGQGARIALALGPRTGSAAHAMRMDRMYPRPHHPGGPKKRTHQNLELASYSQPSLPYFCEFAMWPAQTQPTSGCLSPLKERAGRTIASPY